MQTLMLAMVTAVGLTALTAAGASAAPLANGLHAAPAHALATQVDYHWRGHHWHHRRWYHGYWRYWD